MKDGLVNQIAVSVCLWNNGKQKINEIQSYLNYYKKIISDYYLKKTF